MKCKKAEEIITTSIDGELEPGLEEQLTDHLESSLGVSRNMSRSNILNGWSVTA